MSGRSSKRGGRARSARRLPPAAALKSDARPGRIGRGFMLSFMMGFALAGGAQWTLRAFRGGPASLHGDQAGQDSGAAAPGLVIAEAQASFQKGYEHFRRERYAEAYREFYRATQIDPTAPEPHMGLAKVYEALDYDERAAEACRLAIEMDPAYHGARVALARLLCDLGRNEESLNILADSARTDPNDPVVWAEIAVNELRLGSPRRAIPMLEKYNRAQGRQDWGYVHLGRAYADAGDMQAAEGALLEAVAINPRSQLGHLWLGKLLATSGRRKEAEPHLNEFRRLRALETQRRQLEEAIAREPEDKTVLVSLLVNLARVRGLQGHTREAVVPLERAADLAPEDQRLQRLLAGLRDSAGPPPTP